MKRRILSLLILGFFIFDCLIAPYAYGCWYKPALWARSEANGKGPNTGDTRGHLHPSMPIGGDPVYLHNGEFVYTKQDVFIPSKGMPLDIQRTYRSQSPDNGPFGYGWSLSYYERIVQRADGSAVWIDGKGSEHVFSHSYGGNFNKPAYLQETLVLEQDGTWILTSKNQLVRTFNVNGHLSSITDRNGNSMSFTYSAQKQAVNGGSPFVKSSLVLGLFLVGYVYHLTGITDTAGRSTTLAYNDDGRLESITDSAGRVTSYSYDSLGNLLSVTYPATDAFGEGTTIEYSYTGTNLEIITDAKDQVYIENFYNAQDKVESQTSGNNTWYFTYDEDGRETEVEDANGNRVVYSLDYRGLLVEKEEYTRGYRDGEPSKYVTTYVYGRWDPRIITLPGGNQVRYDYDTYDNIVRKKLVPAPGSSDPTLITEFSYEYEYNFIKTREDPRGNITTYYYDYEEASSGDLNGDGVTDGNEGNLVKISYPSAGGTTPEVKLQYNDAGQVTKVIDANGLVTEYQYSAAAGYLTRVIRDPAGLALTTEMTYDSAGNVLTVKDPRGYITTFTYDEHNNLLQAQAPAPWNHLVKYTYDANDNLVRIERQTSDAGNPWETSEFTYDILDRVTSYTNDLNQTISVTYDGNGNRAGITDAANKSVQYVYDERDLLLNATDAQGYTTTYNYNNNSDLNELVDARGNEVAFYHDSYDRFNRSYQAGGVDEYYSYDNASNLVNLNNSASRSISYSYDALNRLTQKSYAGGGSVNYTYDAGSRLTDAVSDNSTINYTYDNASRVTQVADGNRTVQYEYDNSSNLVKLTYPDSSYITYTYDELNRLKAIKNQAGQEVVNYTYDNLSRRSKAALLNGMEALYDYDAAGRLISLTNRIASNQTMVSQYNYTYDAAGNRLSMQTLNGTHNYTYDDSYQLTGVTYPAGHFAGNTTYGYDEVGNRQWVDVAGGANTSYTVDADTNRYTQWGSSNATYDYLGSMVEAGEWNYSYDKENRLTGASTNATTASYTYDAFGRRIEKSVNGTVTKFVYSGDQIVAEYDGNDTLLRKYIYGPGIDEPLAMITANNTSYYYHAAGLGSVSEVTDSNRAVVESYSYDVYGETQIKDDEGEVISESAIGNRYGFTGREYDGETGLYHYRARSYNPEVGRFMQHDPLKIYDENAYSYCYNDPLNWVDPSGLQVLDPGVLFGIIQGGGVIIQIIPSGIVVGNVHSGSTGGTDLFSVPATTDDEDDPPPTDVRPNDAEKEKERIKPKAGGKAARRGESAKGGTRTQAVGVSGQVTNAAARGGNKGKKLRELRKRLKTLWDHWQKYRNPRDPYEKALMRRQIRKMIREIRKRFPKPIWGIFK